MNLCDQNSDYLKQYSDYCCDTIKKDILGILKNLQAAHGDSTASPLPPLRRQPREAACKHRESVMQYFGYVVTGWHALACDEL